MFSTGDGEVLSIIGTWRENGFLLGRKVALSPIQLCQSLCAHTLWGRVELALEWQMGLLHPAWYPHKQVVWVKGWPSRWALKLTLPKASTIEAHLHVTFEHPLPRCPWLFSFYQQPVSLCFSQDQPPAPLNYQVRGMLLQPTWAPESVQCFK